LREETVVSMRSVTVVSTALAVGIAAMWLVEAGAGSGLGPGIPDAEVELAVPPPATGIVEPPASGDESVEVEARRLHASSLAGVWLQVGDPNWLGLLVWFDPNERRFALDDIGRLPATPAAQGTFELAGDRLIFESEGSSLCNEGDRWEWQADRTRDGLHVVHTRSSPPPCRIEGGTEWTFIRVSPWSAASERAHRRHEADRPQSPQEAHPPDGRFYVR
jgi:hypothetical protein